MNDNGVKFVKKKLLFTSSDHPHSVPGCIILFHNANERALENPNINHFLTERGNSIRTQYSSTCAY